MIHQLDFNGLDKVDKAIMRLQTYEPTEGYYLCFSGGKDSCVIKALADMAKVKYDAHYSVSSVDPPKDDFYKARISTLERENLKLAEALKKAERFGNVMEKLTGPVDGAFVSRAEYEDLNREYAEMSANYFDCLDKIADLKEALVRAALREVE